MTARKMNSLGTQHLEKYSKFLSKFEDQKIFHLGIIVQRYFYFAELQIRDFERNCGMYFDRNNTIDYSEACYSNSFSFYALIRTCLEASKILSSEIQKREKTGKLEKYRQEHFKEIKKIIDIANNIVKHPQKNPMTNKIFFYEPGGLDNFGNMGIYEWSNPHNMLKVLEINPIKDCNVVYKYLEDLAPIYLENISN